MAAVTFSAKRQTTFSAPIEGRDPDSPLEGLSIRRLHFPTVISDSQNRVVTVKSLDIKPVANIGIAYGLYVESPTNETASTTVDSVYSAYFKALTTAGAGNVTRSYGIAVERPTVGGNTSILSFGDIQIGDETTPPAITSIDVNSPTFNLANSTVETINFAGAATTLNIGYSDTTTTHTINVGTSALVSGETKTINIGTDGLLGSTTQINIGSPDSTTSVSIPGTISNGTWEGNIIDSAYGGTGVDNAGRTLTIDNDDITFNAATGGSIIDLPASGTLSTEDGVAELLNKTLEFGTGGTNTLKLPYQGAAPGGGETKTTITAITDNDGVLATKSYVDAVRTGLDVKDSVRAATTANITSLSGTATPVDTINVVAGNRVLVKNQIDAKQNGIYIVQSPGAWIRSDDFCSAQFTATTTTNSKQLTVVLTSGKIVVGQHIVGAGIPSDTHIASFTGGPTNYAIVMTKEASASGSVELFSTNISSGAFIFVEEGSSGVTGNDNAGFVLNTQSTFNGGYLFVDTVTTYPDPSGTPITKAADEMNFTRFSSPGNYSAASGGGLSLTELAFSIDTNHTEVIDWIKDPTTANFQAALDASTGTTTNYTGWNTAAKIVFNDTPDIASGITTTSSTFNLLSNSANTLNIGGLASVINVGSSRVGNLNINIGDGVTTTGNVKNVYFGTGGASGSTTTMYMGAENGTSVLHMDFGTIHNAKSTVSLFDDSTLATLTIATQTGLTDLTIGSHVANFSIGHQSTAASQAVEMFSGFTSGGTYNFATGAMTAGTREINIGTGATGGTTNITMGSIAGTNEIALNSNLISTTSTDIDLFVTNATVLNFAALSETLSIGDEVTDNQSIYIGNGVTTTGNTKAIYIGTGSVLGTTNINIGGEIGTINLNGGTISSINTTLSVFESADDITMGASTATIRLNGGTVATDNTSLNLFNTTTTTINFAGAATSLNVGNADGRMTVLGTTESPSPLIKGTQTLPTAAAGSYHRSGQYLLHGTASGTATKVLTFDGAAISNSNIPTIPEESTWHAKVFVVAYNVTDGEGASWEITTMFRRKASGATPIAMLGDPVVISAADTNAASLQVTIEEDNTNNGIKITAGGGAAGKTYYWTAMVQTVEVG